MNHIHITFVPNDPDIKIDKILDDNTPLLNLTYMTTAPFYNYADRFFDSIYQEINDEYELTVEGEAFEYYFIRDLAENDQNCKSVTWKNVAPHPSNRVGKLLYYNTTSLTFPAGVCEATSAEQALLLLVNAAELSTAEAQMMRSFGTQFLMFQGQTCKLTGRRGGIGKFVWEFDDVNYFKEIVKAMYFRFLPQNVGVNPQPAPPVPTVVEVADFAPLELGKTATPQYRLVSGKGPIPSIRMISDNADVAQIDAQGRICAKGEGNTAISFYLPNETTSFCRKSISVYDPHYAKKLSLTVSEQDICVGTVFRVDHTVEPAQASDAQRINFKYSPNHLLKHLGGNQFRAETPGTVIIEAKTFGGATATVKVNIYAKPTHIDVNIPERDHLFVNDEREITARIMPGNAIGSKINFQSSDETVATVAEDQRGKLFLQAKGMGRCELTFVSADDPNLKCVVPIEVKSMMYSDKIHQMSYWGILLAVLSCFMIGHNMILLRILHVLAQGAIGFFAIKWKRAEKCPSIYGAGKMSPGVKNTITISAILLIWSILLLFLP